MTAAERARRDQSGHAGGERGQGLRGLPSLLRRASGNGARPSVAARRAAAAAGLALLAAGAGIAAFRLYADGLGPLDLAAARERSTVVLDRDGRLLRAFTMADGRWRLPVTVREVDPRFLDLLVAYEDARFRRHGGVDGLALARAAAQIAANGRVVSGGSTLTMQVARLLEPREERSLAAKLRQMARARELERRFSKDEILTLYLGLAPYGGNLEGLRAASLAYFGKEPKRLSLGEAALLVALPQAPELRRPDRSPEAARRARDRVLDRALARGLITPAEAAAARAEAVPRERRPFPALAAHAAEAAVRQAPAERVHRLTVEARLQASLEALARESAERAGPGISAAVLVVDNATGAVRAHVGAADYFAADRAGSVDATEAVRSPGSALKPFIYALAFENGLAHPETVLDDRPSRYGLYAPENFDLAYQGTVTARRALQLSLNVPAVALLAEVGPPRLLARLRGAGADIVLPREGAPGLAVGLGGLGIRLTDLARLYAGLARGGGVPDLVRRQGETGARPAARARIADPVAAWYVADILKGAPAPVNALPGRIAFKTGTSYGYRDAWAAGFDRRTTVAVWLGRPDGAAVPGLVARSVAAPMLFEAFARLGEEPEAIPAPPNVLFATSATLPPPLRHLRKDAPKTIAATASAPLRIAFPPDGARVDLGLGRAGEGAAPLALKATGGVPPLTWFVNGAPVAEREIRRQSSWLPDGAGFARVSVVDARGATDSVAVRLE
ncbi:penicillin-binding protein 1C [Chelatococcus sp. SYSU_G07232]|uniref:peptidoglycan glycosyltransferase n=1 Tax=Chelatococcus albus TaxID=3047466 RepID=A0ABT7AI86_9HYPH|nr:penicillin-binding protein 1C [Chelatococcus sp. SYSU_G07232]MDJ1159095.1 penicillin-binding protein 1C [Chelatococcus sp. SYSU_G07232]